MDERRKKLRAIYVSKDALRKMIYCQEIGYRYGREKRDEAIKAIREYIEMLQLEPDENKL